jgi:hypothetical protein
LPWSVLNPDQIQPVDYGLSVAAVGLQQSGTPRAIVSVAQTGLTALSYTGLTEIGFPLAGIDPRMLRLTRAGSEIAMQWAGNEDAIFEMGERLLFYADPRFSRWTKSDVYFLSIGVQAGLRMTSRPANPAPQPSGSAWVTQTYEINALYTPTCYCWLQRIMSADAPIHLVGINLDAITMTDLVGNGGNRHRDTAEHPRPVERRRRADRLHRSFVRASVGRRPPLSSRRYCRPAQ